MTKYRHSLPQLSGKHFLTDGGLETTLIFLENISLPHFAAFDLLKTEDGCEALKRYFKTYAKLAQKHKTGLILESATWRASQDWAKKLGHTKQSLAQANRKSITILEEIRAEFETEDSPMVISGCFGPRGDGYVASQIMSAGEAEDYHKEQMEAFKTTSVDMVSAITMNYLEEAVGITRAAQAAKIPVVVSFTVETDGRLPTGQTLESAITETDRQTHNGPVYYMINCAHPTHFDTILKKPTGWMKRIRGLRANASKKSHAELNESTTLDFGDPVEFGLEHREIKGRLKHINVIGGCCGTDHRHIEEIGKACYK